MGLWTSPGSELRLFRFRRRSGEAEAMNARFRHPSAQGSTAVQRPASDIATTPAAPADLGGRACCCSARAVVRVIMPPTSARAHETELLLCGHHYRVSRHALEAVSAAICALPGTSPDSAAWIGLDYSPVRVS